MDMFEKSLNHQKRKRVDSDAMSLSGMLAIERAKESLQKEVSSGINNMKGFLNETSVKIKYDEKSSILGLFDPERNTITIGSKAVSQGLEIVKSTLYHEIIHAAQYHNDIASIENKNLPAEGVLTKGSYLSPSGGEKGGPNWDNAQRFISEIETHTREMERVITMDFKDVNMNKHFEITAQKLASYEYWMNRLLKNSSTQQYIKNWLREQMREIQPLVKMVKQEYLKRSKYKDAFTTKYQYTEPQ